MPLVRANGKPLEVADGTTVLDLIRARALQPTTVVVEHNGAPLERARYAEVRLRAGDSVEIVRAVAGG
jgi:sulfur carrier protein